VAGGKRSGEASGAERSQGAPRADHGWDRAGDPMRAAPLPAVPSVRDVVAGAGVFGSAPSSFRDLPIEPKLASHIEEHLQLPKPTLIQARAVPAILSGKDALVRAETGSGKTIAYLLPIVQRLINSSREQKFTREQGTLALVLTPTRELSFQTLEACEALTRPLPWIVCGAVLGGESRKSEKARLRKGVTVLVATPGRLDDHIQHTERLRVDYLQAIVLDEADRLLDLGFGEKILAILALLDERRREGVNAQRILVSATLPANVLELASKALREPEYVRARGPGEDSEELQVVPVGMERTQKQPPQQKRFRESDGEEDEDEDGVAALAKDGRTAAADKKDSAMARGEGEEQLSAPKQLKQHFVLVPAKLRLVTLTTLLASSLRHGEATGAKVLVFASTGLQVEFLGDLLRREADARSTLAELAEAKAKASAKPGDEPAGGGFKAGGLTRSGVYALHGSMAQSERTSVWRGFCAAKSGVLIATDVVARGLNLDGVAQIIQFDLPADPMEYVHRIGRTARIGKAGSALLFVLPSEAGFLELLKSRGLELSEVRYESVQAALGGAGRVLNTAEARKAIFEAEVALQHRLERIVSSDKELHDLAGRAFQSFLCAYAAHPKATKSLLRLKDLHLGHIAKGFGLKEPPTQFSFASQQKTASKHKAKGRTSGVVNGQRKAWRSDELTPSLKPGDKPASKKLTPAKRLEATRGKIPSGSGSKGISKGATSAGLLGAGGVKRPVNRKMPG